MIKKIKAIVLFNFAIIVFAIANIIQELVILGFVATEKPEQLLIELSRSGTVVFVNMLALLALIIATYVLIKRN